MNREFDVIIVGGGPGGLAIGCLLAKEGVSSAIIEKDPALGGRYRSVDFHGCRVDSATHFLVSLSGSTEKTAAYEYFSQLEIPLEQKMVPWTMGLVSKESPGHIRHFEMDPKLGAGNFFQFFAFATGVEMGPESKEEITRVATICADLSLEECHKLVNVRFSDWIDQQVGDPIAQAVMHGMGPVIGAPPSRINFGFVASAFKTFNEAGAPLPWYPKNGTLETAMIAPLEKYYTDHGGQVITNRTVREIAIEDGIARGVVAADHQNLSMLEEYSARVVICAIPIFEAVAKNVLGQEHLTEDWAESIRRCAEMAGPDLSGFFLLNQDVVPRDGYGWLHIFDNDYGVPTYVGDLTLGSFLNSSEPKGKQLVTSMVPGSLDLSGFGLAPQMDKVRQAQARWKESMEKGFPGFGAAIEHEGMNLQLNFTRYAYAVVDTEIDIQSPNIGGLYFGGDSIWAVGNPCSDKCFQIAFPLRDRVLEYVRS
ncbi:MAG: NAD(P)-binding protein [Dehalococcoidia bacterium]